MSCMWDLYMGACVNLSVVGERRPRLEDALDAERLGQGQADRVVTTLLPRIADRCS